MGYVAEYFTDGADEDVNGCSHTASVLHVHEISGFPSAVLTHQTRI